MSDAATRPTAWEPQPGFQTAFVNCPVFEIFGGGARGGGKSFAVLGDWAIHSSEHGRDAVGLMVRRSRTELLELFEQARAIYGKVGAQLTYNPMRITMSNGARLTFAYLERDADAEVYQGWSTTRVYVEEAGNFPSPAPIMKLMATLRSGAGVPVGMRLTGNPGGAGHGWLRARYIDPAPMGWQIITDPVTKLQRIFIPSRVTDNKYLGADYVQRLKASGSPELVRAWLEGDWSVVSGAFFPEFSMDRHVIAPRELPQHWQRFRSFDWGSARPFSVGWWAVSDGTLPDIARGALVRYREWYGMKPGEPNVGLRMTAEEIARGIALREEDEPRPIIGVADPAIFAEDGGPSIAQRMILQGVVLRPADNKRVAARGAMGGWDQVRSRLAGDEDGRPMMLFFSTCRDLIRTLPALQHDDARPEDVDSDMEDHAPDECFVASTRIRTKRGQVCIDRVRVGDMALTRDGYQPVTAVFTNGECPVMDVRLSNGATLTGTANHPIWVEGEGFISLSSLRYGDMMRPCQYQSSANAPKSSLASGITSVASIINARAGDYIAWCGSILTAQFRRVRISTIGIMIAPTTRLAISSVSLVRGISPIMVSCTAPSRPTISTGMPGLRQLSGMAQRKVWRGIASTGSRIAKLVFIALPRLPASSVARPSRPPTMGRIAFVPTHARQNGADNRASIISSDDVPRVASRSQLTSMASSGIAREIAPLREHMSGSIETLRAAFAGRRSKRGISARSGALTVVGEPTLVGLQRVYNISVEGAEEYFANGVLVHNCRYACMSRPFVRDAVKPKVEDSWDRAFRRAGDSDAAGWRIV